MAAASDIASGVSFSIPLPYRNQALKAGGVAPGAKAGNPASTATTAPGGIRPATRCAIALALSLAGLTGGIPVTRPARRHWRRGRQRSG